MRASVATVIVMGLLIPRTAAAQPAPWAPERLTAGWVFTPSGVFGVLHDSNVTLRAVNEPITAEAVALVNPRGEMDFNGRRTHFNIGYSGALEAYRELSELNRYEQHGRLELRHQAMPHLQLHSTAAYSSVPTTDRLTLGPGVLPFIGIGSQHFEANGGFNLQASPRTKIEGGVSYQTIHFDREQPLGPDEFTRYLRDGHSFSPSLSAMYGVAKHVSVGAAWSYRRAVVSEGTQIVDVQSSTAELEWQAAEHTSVRGGVGAAYLKSDTELVSRWGPAYHIGLDHTEGRVELAAKYERAFVPSIGFGGLSADQRFSGSAKVPLGVGRWTVGGTVAYGQIEPVDLLGVDYTLNSLWAQGTVGYQVARWLRAEGFYNRSHQTSTARGLVDRTRIGIEFVTSKPVRIQ
jgi:hypothetical protein